MSQTVAVHLRGLVPLPPLAVYFPQVAQRHDDIGMVRRQHPAFDPQSPLITPQRVVEPFPLEVKVPHPIQEHGDL